MKKLKNMNSVYRLLIAIFTLITPYLTFAETEIQIDGAKLNISESSQSNARVNFTLNNPNQKVTAMIVENPKRLVFDIHNLILKGSKNFDINSEIFKKIRVGAHKEKTRIVFDCLTDNIKDVEDLSSDKNISFSISGDKNDVASKNNKVESPTEEPKNELPTPTAAAIATNTPEVIASIAASETQKSETPKIETTIAPTIAEPTPILETNENKIPTSKKIDPNQIDTLSEEESALEVIDPSAASTTSLSESIKPIENESISDVEKKLQPEIENKIAIANETSNDNIALNIEQSELQNTETGQLTIKSIVFQTTAEKMQSSMVITTSAPVTYSINKTSNNSYELLIPGAKLKGNHLSLPQYSPDSFKGFYFFQAKETDTGVNIRIDVEEGVNLSPYLAMGKLWIKAE